MRTPLRLTSLGLTLVTATAFTASLPLLGLPLPTLLLSTLASVTAGSLAAASLSAGALEDVRVERRRAIIAVEGELLEVEVRVCNHARAPVTRLRVTDKPPFYHGEEAATSVLILPPGSCAAHRYRLEVRPGLYHLGPVRLEAGDPLGVYTSSRMAGPAAKLVGLVESIPVARRVRAAATTAVMGAARGAARGPGVTFLSLREYTPDDDARMIDWKSLARLGKPLVKEFERESPRRLLVVLDATPTSLAWEPSRREPRAASNARLAYTLVEAAVASATQARLVRIDPDASTEDTGWLTSRAGLSRARLTASKLDVSKSGECRGIEERGRALAGIVRGARGSLLVLLTDACSDARLASLYARLLAAHRGPRIAACAGSCEGFAARAAPVLARIAEVYTGPPDNVAVRLAARLALA